VRLAVISDTHLPRGERRLPRRCVALARESDLIVHAGDLSTVAVLDDLQALGPPVVAVHGNVDEPALRARLPAQRVLEVGSLRLGLIHDGGRAPGRLARLRRRFPEVQAVIYGHSHIPRHDCLEGFAIFNPGSPTDRRRQPVATMGLAHVDGVDVRFELVELPAELRRWRPAAAGPAPGA